MFQKSLKENYDKILLTYESNNFTGGDILKRSVCYTKIFEMLAIKSPDIVGIYTSDPTISIPAIIACMTYGVSFAIFSTSDSEIDVLTKMSITSESSYSWLLLSEVIVDPITLNTLTIDPITFDIISKGIGYKSVPEEIQDELNYTFQSIRNLKKKEKGMVKKFLTLPQNHFQASSSHLFGVVYHNGISKEVYNASKIPIGSIYKGIRSIIEKEHYYVPEPLLFLEYFNQLYNITNGILVPILKGTRVIVKAETDYYSIVDTCSHLNVRSLYTSSSKLEYILQVLEKDTTPLLRYWLFKPFLKRIVKMKFNKIFNSSIKKLFINGKINRRDLINALKIKHYSLLYTMTEVATYIASRNYNKIPKRIGLIPRLDSTINILKPDGANMGEIVVYTEDMLQGYLTVNHTKEYLLNTKTTEGKLCTQDIGYVKNGLLYVIDKAIHIFSTEQGMTLENGKIIKTAQNFDYVKSAHLINLKGKPTLVIEPDFDFIENVQMSPQSVYNRMETIKVTVNKRVSAYSKIAAVILYEDPKGLPRKNSKIISRYF